MPIVTIQAVMGIDDEAYDAATVQQLADRLGNCLASEPGTTWIKMTYLDRHQYAENLTTLDETIRPTFVEVLKRSLPDQASLASEAKDIAAAVAEVLFRPRQNVHIVYLPAGAGRVAFGGNLVRDENHET